MLEFHGLVQVLGSEGSRPFGDGGVVYTFLTGAPLNPSELVPQTGRAFHLYKVDIIGKTPPEGVETGMVLDVRGTIKGTNWPKYQRRQVYHNLSVTKVIPLFRMPIKVDMATHLSNVPYTHRGYEENK